MGSADVSNPSRAQSRPATGTRRGVRADRPESVIRTWSGRSKAFGTRALYGSVAGAVTALVAMIAAVALGFDAAVIAILAIGLGMTGLVVWLAPPAYSVMRPASRIAVGDLLATRDDDFVVRVAPVVVATVALRGGAKVYQFGTASGAAFEVSETGRLPVVLFGRDRGRAAGIALDPNRSDPSWPWAEVVAILVGRLVENGRAGGSGPTRDQVTADLVERVKCTAPTARHALESAVGLGLVRAGRTVTVTPAGAVWHASRTFGVGGRIEAPRWIDPGTPDGDDSAPVRLVGQVVDLSAERTDAVGVAGFPHRSR